ncbi:SDR family NAD(P)-dependent oxidoreductase [Siansivirga zeaxanthinifaciens]|uniref:Polysaccharide biosynthesis protein n=1 Tax=Siansivirga zeaxanthinifaciens CC-SAMT-1 TaxID=1454006 RepID=A0A0C5WN53_9FLAO|nr:SDR family NAD(P)-dependent oxidoreductase [Siansivirga zeaxanthinifaciens]AJR04280.1 polysaccharide biosynthesis protein [Siansivirga zeaxanthinifaciens CC-SAMT-1]
MESSEKAHIKNLILSSGLTHLNNTFSDDYKKIFNFENEIILITGAAGSIGKELTNQLLKSKFKKLILIDISETGLYNVSLDIKQKTIENVDVFILDITDESALEFIFKTHKPDIVFHAAANKNVVMMEKNPYQAIKTNVFGTKLLADFSIKNQVKKFVFISTDKAVQPVSIMGMTKKISENYLHSVSKSNKTQFSIARFGNIIGSNGSVLPVFLNRIALGLPLQINHVEMTRYFIDKTKACSLILELAFLTDNNYNTFTFNMGHPINILSLAKELLSIYNLDDNHLEITEAHQGEKIHEIICTDDEALIPTKHPDIFKIQSKSTNFNMDFDKLSKIKPSTSFEEIKSILTSYL